MAQLLRVALGLIACSGCATDGAGSGARWMGWRRPQAQASTAAVVAADADGTNPQSANPPGKDSAPQSTPPAGPASAKAPDQSEMMAVLNQLKATGAIDQATQDRLFEDLQKTDPALWPQMLEVFRASLAYRQKYVEPPRADQVAGPSSPKHTGPQAPPIDKPAASEPAKGPNSAETATAEISAAAPQAAAPAGSAPASKPPAADQTATGQTATGQTATVLATATTPVQPNPEPAAAPAEPQRLDWRDHLQAAIAGLESETTDPPGTTAAIGRHAGLRLLYLVDGRREPALKPIAGIPPTQQDFWSKELFALATYLDAERTADESRRAAAAGVPLREAAAKLGELATLSVRNLAFCTEVNSYGVYKKFPKYEFQAGQEVLLYAEVENFKTLANEKGFHTALKSSYEILDSHGARVDQKEFEITAEDCQNPRRDYFIRYFVWMPKRIYGGSYSLQLTIEDTLSQKIGQSSIDFAIHEKDN